MTSEQSGGRQAAPTARFGTLAEFVEWLASIWEQKISSQSIATWCPHWFEHPEAVLRLEAMWRSFEAARTDPLNGMATWLRDIADYQMSQLTSGDGPFRRCRENGHRPPTLEITSAPVPDGYLAQQE